MILKKQKYSPLFVMIMRINKKRNETQKFWGSMGLINFTYSLAIIFNLKSASLILQIAGERMTRIEINPPLLFL